MVIARQKQNTTTRSINGTLRSCILLRRRRRRYPASVAYPFSLHSRYVRPDIITITRRGRIRYHSARSAVVGFPVAARRVRTPYVRPTVRCTNTRRVSNQLRCRECVCLVRPVKVVARQRVRPNDNGHGGEEERQTAKGRGEFCSPKKRYGCVARVNGSSAQRPARRLRHAPILCRPLTHPCPVRPLD